MSSLVLLVLLACGATEAPATQPAAAPATQPSAAESEAEKEIRSSVAQYVKAWNAGDLEQVALLYAPDAEYRLGDQVIRGRDAILQRMKEGHKPGAKMEVQVESIRFTRPGMAIERGTATVTPPEGEAAVERYRVIHVRKDDKWQIQSVSEDTARGQANEALSQLDWMVGRWVDASEDADIEVICSWTDNKRFLLRTFVVRDPDLPELKVSELIGWDPKSDGIRSWVFDSDGGFGQSTWRNRAGDWLILAKAVLPDGGDASAIQILHPVDKDAFTWSASNREVDGNLLPDIDEIRFVRSSSDEAAADASQRRQP